MVVDRLDRRRRGGPSCRRSTSLGIWTRVRHHRSPCSGHHGRHLPRRRDAIDDPGEPVRVDEPRSRVEHRLRRARPAGRQPLDPRTRRRQRPDGLFGVLRHSGASLSAHQTMEAEYELHGGIDRLAAELETIAAEAQHDRFVDLLRRSGLTAEQHATSSSRLPSARWRRRCAGPRHTTTTWNDSSPGSWVSTVSMTPTTSPPCSGTASRRDSLPRAGTLRSTPADRRPHTRTSRPDGRQTASHSRRKELIETRARALAEEAIQSHAAWVLRLGAFPSSGEARERWISPPARSRPTATDTRRPDGPLAAELPSDARRADRHRVLRAMRDAQGLAAVRPTTPSTSLISRFRPFHVHEARIVHVCPQIVTSPSHARDHGSTEERTNELIGGPMLFLLSSRRYSDGVFTPLLRLYAPSNVLTARLRAASPRWRTAGALVAMALLLVAGGRGLDVGIAAGATAWLNVAVLILVWDAIKLSWFAVEVAARVGLPLHRAETAEERATLLRTVSAPGGRHHDDCGDRMMAPRPTWLTETCPSWCVREHHEQDFPDDRYHRSEPSTFPAIVVTGPGVHLTDLMHGLDIVVWVGRYVDELVDWMVIEPAEYRDPHLIITVDSSALLLDQIALQVEPDGAGYAEGAERRLGNSPRPRLPDAPNAALLSVTGERVGAMTETSSDATVRPATHPCVLGSFSSGAVVASCS